MANKLTMQLFYEGSPVCIAALICMLKHCLLGCIIQTKTPHHPSISYHQIHWAKRTLFSHWTLDEKRFFWTDRIVTVSFISLVLAVTACEVRWRLLDWAGSCIAVFFFSSQGRWYRKAAACPLRRCTIDLLPDAIFSLMQHEMERLISPCVFFFPTRYRCVNFVTVWVLQAHGVKANVSMCTISTSIDKEKKAELAGTVVWRPGDREACLAGGQ